MFPSFNVQIFIYLFLCSYAVSKADTDVVINELDLDIQDFSGKDNQILENLYCEGHVITKPERILSATFQTSTAACRSVTV